MNNLEYIDAFFKQPPADADKKAFEEKVVTDEEFAEDVAFYLSAQSAFQQQTNQQKKEHFKKLYQQQSADVTKEPVKRLWKYAIAASVIGIAVVLSVFLFSRQPEAAQLADEYIQENLIHQSVTMDTKADEMQRALQLFNDGALAKALQYINEIIKKDLSNTEATKYAGIIHLRLGNYNDAITHFSRLEAYTSLYSNPGKFYRALTLLKRQGAGDVEQAKLLLQQVVDNHLQGEHTAKSWLKNL